MADSKKSNFIATSVLLLISLAVAGASGELLLRALGHHGIPLSSIKNIISVDDPILNWRIAPNSERIEGQIIYRFNSEGFRDIEHSAEIDKDTKRIMVLGDSVTVGYGVAEDEIFSSVLRSRLAGNTEVFNIAAGGLNSPQEVHLLKLEGLKYKPDVVVVNFVLNDGDFYSNRHGGRKFQKEKDTSIGLLGGIGINPEFKRILKSSALIYFVKTQLENIKGRITGDMTVDYDYFENLWAKESNRKKITESFAELDRLASANDFEVVVLIWPLLADYGEYRYGKIHDWVYGQARSHDFIVLDLLQAYSKYSFRDLQVSAEDNVHPNAAGHKLAAEYFIQAYKP